jgi:colicin import membrane protein
MEMDADKTEKRKVGRPGLSYDEISQAAFEVRASGRRVTIDAVRQALGNKGGKGTIHTALQVWHEQNPVTTVAVAPELPPALLRDIGRALDRVADEARADIQERLVASQESANGLAEDVTALENQQEALQEAVTALTSERDQAMALAQERAQEILRLGDALTREQAAAEAARVELAKLQLRSEAEAARVLEQAQEIVQLREALAAESAARQAADRGLVEAQARLDAERDAKAEALAREKAAMEREREAVAKGQEALARIDTVRAEIQAVAERHVGEARAAADIRIAEIQAVAAREVAELKARIAEIDRELAQERSAAAGAEARCGMLDAQVADLRLRLDRAESALEKAREHYQTIVERVADTGEAAASALKEVIPKPRKRGAQEQQGSLS